jgi:hypothetical protein
MAKQQIGYRTSSMTLRLPLRTVEKNGRRIRYEFFQASANLSIRWDLYSRSAAERLKAFEEFTADFESPVVLPEEAFHRENWYPDR